MGDFVIFWYFFRISGLGGFCALYEPDGIARRGSYNAPS